jgi:ABC-type sugar transport system permease subunit
MILAASDFVTVFEIARGSNGVFASEVFRLFVGVAALIGGGTALIFKWRNNKLKSWVGPVFVTAWACFGFTCTIFLMCLGTSTATVRN